MLEIKPNDWITIGDNVNAVVCNIYEQNDNIIRAEVVYLNGTKAINEDVFYKDGHWDFVHKGADGGYADNYPRLSRFVGTLRRGRS